MDNIKLDKYIQHFLEGKLTDNEEKELLFWIKANEKNKKQFLDAQNRLIRGLTLNNSPEYIQKWKLLKSQISKSESSSINRQLYIKAASIAAAFLLGAVLTFFVSNYITSLKKQFVEQTISVPYGARTNITLPDGSLVWLNSGSTLIFPVVFGKSRPVTLKGEAFFEIEKDEKPFLVNTECGEVEVKGTSFNVQAFANESEQVTLVEGAVLYREKENEKEVALHPGEQICFKDGLLQVKTVDPDLFTSWKEGKLIFRKEYLPSMVKRLERWYNVKIELDNDQRLNDIWFTGTLEMESFSEVLELIKVTSPIDYSYDEKKRTIKIKYAST